MGGMDREAVGAGSAVVLGLPRTRRDSHDAIRRVTRRTDHAASLVGRPGRALRLPARMARTATRATASALVIEAFAIQL
jgi:hypothetical protein